MISIEDPLTYAVLYWSFAYSYQRQTSDGRAFKLGKRLRPSPAVCIESTSFGGRFTLDGKPYPQNVVPFG